VVGNRFGRAPQHARKMPTDPTPRSSTTRSSRFLLSLLSANPQMNRSLLQNQAARSATLMCKVALCLPSETISTLALGKAQAQGYSLMVQEQSRSQDTLLCRLTIWLARSEAKPARREEISIPLTYWYQSTCLFCLGMVSSIPCFVQRQSLDSTKEEALVETLSPIANILPLVNTMLSGTDLLPFPLHLVICCQIKTSKKCEQHVISRTCIASTEPGLHPHLAAISVASLLASSMGSSTHLVTSPNSAASFPSTMRPVMVSSLATSIRTNSRSVTDADMSGIKPHFASMMESLQSGVAKRKSAPNAICIPPTGSRERNEHFSGSAVQTQRIVYTTHVHASYLQNTLRATL